MLKKMREDVEEGFLGFEERFERLLEMQNTYLNKLNKNFDTLLVPVGEI